MTTRRTETIMIDSHPGGISLTRRLFEMAESEIIKGLSQQHQNDGSSAIKILDLGAGKGESVRFLREAGFETEGIDIVCRGNWDIVKEMDMCSLEYLENSFSICMAECSLSGCGDGAAALREAWRVLSPGGFLLVSDVFFGKEDAPCMSMGGPLTKERWLQEFMQAGFEVKSWKDETPLWREFFFESLWNGTADEACVDMFREYGKAKCGYFLAVLKKGGAYGFI